MNFSSSGSSGEGSSVFSLPLITRPVVPSSEIQSPARSLAFDAHLSRFFIDVDVAGSGYAALPMPRVTTAAWLVMHRRSENALGDFHAVDVFRRGFGAHQNHGTFRSSPAFSTLRRR